MTKRTVSYDPGKPQPARLVNQNEQLYAIDSFRCEEKSYLVNLKTSTCTCPHWQARLKGSGQDCKHLTDVRRQARFLKLLQTARALTDDTLALLLRKYTEQEDWETAGAIRCAREERRRATARDAALKAVFA